MICQIPANFGQYWTRLIFSTNKKALKSKGHKRSAVAQKMLLSFTFAL